MKYVLAALAAIAIGTTIVALVFKADVERMRADAAVQATADMAKKLKASEAARAKEHEQAGHFHAIAQQYEQDKTDAEARATRLAADLRAERVRLRPEWRCVPQAPASAGKPDAAADDRAASAARVVRAAADADDQIRALQAILKAERQ